MSRGHLVLFNFTVFAQLPACCHCYCSVTSFLYITWFVSRQSFAVTKMFSLRLSLLLITDIVTFTSYLHPIRTTVCKYFVIYLNGNMRYRNVVHLWCSRMPSRQNIGPTESIVSTITK